MEYKLMKIHEELERINKYNEKLTKDEIDIIQKVLFEMTKTITNIEMTGVNINKSFQIQFNIDDLKSFYYLLFDTHEHGGYIDIDQYGFDKSILLRGNSENIGIDYIFEDLEIQYHTHPLYHINKKNIFSMIFFSFPSHSDLINGITTIVNNQSQVRILFTISGVFVMEPIKEYAIYNQKGETIKEKKENRNKKIDENLEKISKSIDKFSNCFINEDIIEFNQEEGNDLIPENVNIDIKDLTQFKFSNDLYKFQIENSNDFLEYFNNCKKEFEKITKFPYNLIYKHWRDIEKTGLTIKNIMPFEPLQNQKIKNKTF